MIKGVRLKFISVAMVSTFVVISIMMININIMNYQALKRETDHIIHLLEEKKMTFDAHYFKVQLDSQALLYNNMRHIDTNKAMMITQEILEKGKDEGFYQDGRYRISNSQLTFLFVGREMDTFESFLGNSLFIALLGWISSSFFIAYFSKKIFEPVEKSEEKQKAFISDASHELKTPLAIIQANKDILSLEYGDNEWLDSIEQQVNRLSELTCDLVLLSRMEEDGQLVYDYFDLSESYNKVASSFYALAKRHEQHLNCIIEPHIMIHGNKKYLEQLLNILLENAIKYTPNHKNISLTVKKGNKGIDILVKNQTKIEMVGDLNRLFERFYRQDQARQENSGYGLGLSVAKAIVLNHHGKIKAVSNKPYEFEINIKLP